MCNFRILTKDDVECRVKQAGIKDGKAWCSLLLYKNARVDRAILDETCTKFGWQDKYEFIDGKLYCTISIKNPATGEWINKMDVGVESNTEKEKGQASDALKRAAFAWGIGVELYSSPKIYIELPEGEYTKSTDNYGKTTIKPKGSFIVSALQVNETTRKIEFVTISNSKGKVVFQWGVKKNSQPDQPPVINKQNTRKRLTQRPARDIAIALATCGSEDEWNSIVAEANSTYEMDQDKWDRINTLIIEIRNNQ